MTDDTHYSPTERRILVLLSDGKAHSVEDMMTCLADELSGLNSLWVAITMLRHKLHRNGRSIMSFRGNRITTYRLVSFRGASRLRFAQRGTNFRHSQFSEGPPRHSERTRVVRRSYDSDRSRRPERVYGGSPLSALGSVERSLDLEWDAAASQPPSRSHIRASSLGPLRGGG